MPQNPPNEQQKLHAPQNWKSQGKMKSKGKSHDIEMEISTTPNATNGYDTRIKLPISPLGGTVNQ